MRRLPLALAVVLLLGIELRVALWFAYDPTPLVFFDSVVYVWMADGHLFGDPARSIGYSLLLDALHAISTQVELTIALQHLLGIATALLIYGAFRRLPAPRWTAVVAAAGVLLSLDQIYIEHSLLSETPFTFALAFVLYASVRVLEGPGKLRYGISTRALWAVAAGIGLGVSAWIRPVSIPLVAILALWLVFAIPGPWRFRLGRAALATVAALAPIFAYSAWQGAENGHFGFSQMAGWTIYSRVAQFADCERFDPPAGTAELCQSVPPDRRPGPDFYAFLEESPARQLFGAPPAGDDELGAFGRAALFAQPLDYLELAAKQSLRYYVPSLGARPFGGVRYDGIAIDRRAPSVEREVAANLYPYYARDELEVSGLVSELADLQQILRLSPVLMAIVTALSIAAAVLSRGRLRAGVLLVLGFSAVLLILPPITAIWNARYAVPVTGPLMGAAAIGAWLLLTGLRGHREAGSA